ncbi:MAG TPA: dienelactone hydrolase family protein [Stellaceae bacterium]|jgi:carboxymethylenebutenolidase|nr:dienelactone hydrolase family protein [Stellaceae bacterium]
MSGRDIEISTPDGAAYQVHLVGETGAPRPALIIYSTVFGVDADMKKMAERWAARGFVVALPDYYHRIAPGVRERNDAGRAEARARWRDLDVDGTMRDLEALTAHLKTSPHCNGRMMALGFCAGGELAFLSALRLGVQAAAAYHGTRVERHLDEAKRLKVPVTLHYGDNDDTIPMGVVEVIQKGLADQKLVDIHVYPEAVHGFSVPGRAQYNEPAAVASDARAQAVFAAA